MHIERLLLKNFRGIRDLEVHFTERTTTFVGVNGVGKSTILDALAIALSQLTWRISGNAQKARPISPNDIHIGADFARIEVTAVGISKQPVTWGITTNLVKDVQDDPLRRSDLEALNKTAKQLAIGWQSIDLLTALNKAIKQQPLDGKPKASSGFPSLPLAVFYDVNRAVLDVPMQIREKLQNTFQEAYQDALSHGGADFKRFFIWFRNLEDAENEARIDQPEYRDPKLDAARSAIEQFTGFTDLRIRRKPKLRMTLRKHDEEFNVEQLSDGERNMLALVGDMARRLSILNPQAQYPNQGKGVVIIDEIDLHLHPRWQREVVGKLESVFPHCQFILSTHSPQVISELKPESVMLLKDGRLLGHAPRALGLDSSEVLEELMEGDARNVEVAQQIQSIHHLLAHDKIQDAQVALDALKASTGDIPATLELDAAIQSLKWLEDDAS
ncbi:AAA family ATPase [Castellaniella defragrans]|nr:AAA family ATPase [Castellaniella defragrans]